MNILDQISQSQLSNKTETGGFKSDIKNSSNYDNTLIATKGNGKVISQIDPLSQSNLAPAPGATTDQSYIQTSFNQTIK